MVVACGISAECSLPFRAIYRTDPTLSLPDLQPNKAFSPSTSELTNDIPCTRAYVTTG
jgi:hypothetical protein